MTFSDIKSEWIWHDSSANDIWKNDTGLAGTMHYDIFRSITRFQTVLLHSIHCKYEFSMLRYIIFLSHTNHVYDYNTLNYTSMTHWVGIYYGRVAFYRDITRKTFSEIKSEWFWHDSSGYNIRKNNTGLTRTMHYDIFRRIKRLQTVLLYSIHCNNEFGILLYIIFVNTY